MFPCVFMNTLVGVHRTPVPNARVFFISINRRGQLDSSAAIEQKICRRLGINFSIGSTFGVEYFLGVDPTESVLRIFTFGRHAYVGIRIGAIVGRKHKWPLAKKRLKTVEI